MTILSKATGPRLIAILIIVASAVYASNQTQKTEQSQTFLPFSSR